MDNFIFLHPWWLLAVFPLALLIITGIHSETTRLIATHLAEAIGARPSHSNWVILFLSIAWFLAVIALSGPSFREIEVPKYRQANARVLLMDMGSSMLATDISPNRLAQARYKALDLLDLWTEGRTGLVAYANDGYMLSPLTEDSQSLREALNTIKPDLMPADGSNAVAGVKESIRLLTDSGVSSGEIIIVTDGIDAQTKQSIVMQRKQAEQIINLANCSGLTCQWRVSILAVGTTHGAPILLGNGKLRQDPKTQSPLVVKLDLNPLQEIAQKTGGILAELSSDYSDIKKIVSQTKRLEAELEKNSESYSKQRQNDGYWLLFPMLMLCAFAFRRGILVSLLFIAFSLSTSSLISSTAYATELLKEESTEPETFSVSPWLTLRQQGDQAYQNGNYKEAIQYYNQAITDGDLSATGALGASYYQNNQYKQAIDTLKPVADNTHLDNLYNLGNAYAKDGQLKEALESYDALLKQDPSYEKAQVNKNLVQAVLEQQKQQQLAQNGEDSDEKNNQNSKEENTQQSNEETSGKESVQSQNEAGERSNDNSHDHDGEQKDQQMNPDQHADKQEQSDSSSEHDQSNGENPFPQDDKKDQDSQNKGDSKEIQEAGEDPQSTADPSSEQENENSDSTDQTQRVQAKPSDSQDSTGENISDALETNSQVSQKDETYQILEQIPIDKGLLLKAQMQLEAQQRARNKRRN